MIVNLSHPTLTNVSLNVYPNPTSDVLYFEVKNHESSTYQLEIWDSKGTVVTLLNFEEKKFALTVDHLTSGNYFYRLSSNDGLKSSGNILIKQ